MVNAAATDAPALLSRSFDVEDYKISAVVAAVARVGKKAKKLGLPAPEVTVGAMKVRRAVEGPDLAAFQDAADFKRCDHCSHRRARKTVYIVENTATGELQQVGSSCVADFLGRSAHDAAAMAAYSTSLGGMSEEAYLDALADGMQPRLRYVDLVSYLACVSALADQNGFVTARVARDHGIQSTAGEALEAWIKLPETPGAVVAEDFERAASAIAWASALEPRSDFERNLRGLARAGYFELGKKHEGIAAFIIEGARRAAEKAAADAAKAAAPVVKRASEHVGREGERLALDVTLVRVRGFETAYGYKRAVTFEANGGDKITWFTTGDLPCEVGETARVKLTVKEHKSDPKWGKETIVSRVSAA